jgi:hypothetical protein
VIAAGLVVKSDTRDLRRIYHKLMARGQATLKAESERLSAVAARPRQRSALAQTAGDTLRLHSRAAYDNHGAVCEWM